MAPVLLIFFNRTDTTLKVIEQLRLAKVSQLYLYCDAGRPNKAAEAQEVEAARALITQSIDWPCEVKTNFLNQNVGPRLAIGNAISWLFEHEEAGIILEHDCLPHLSFFPYCNSLLEKYKTDQRILHIAGDNFHFGKRLNTDSYFFSKYPYIWGFATWRRAWQQYDVDMEAFPKFKKAGLIKEIIQDKRLAKYWENIFELTYQKKVESWDYQWTFSVWNANGLSIIPQVNLVSNIGFDAKALNTTNPDHAIANMKQEELIFPLQHPTQFVPHMQAENQIWNEYLAPHWKAYWKQRLRKLIGK
jgi:hypothetical protein